ncbi:MAG: GNAT family N-acetyltransferase [Tannerellaceae bacterium]|nr:GNAT family N-acetyltransferase [Tannerellaceae bacterium]
MEPDNEPFIPEDRKDIAPMVEVMAAIRELKKNDQALKNMIMIKTSSNTHNSLQIRKGQRIDFPEIMNVWESSVKATHDFLKLEDFEFYKRIGSKDFLPAMDLYVLQLDEKIIGFIGVSDKHLEMLFVEANSIGKGYGKALLSYAVEHLGITTLDVNEQNEKALTFYEKAGFRIVGRSEKDGMGKNYPILHMGIKVNI